MFLLFACMLVVSQKNYGGLDWLNDDVDFEAEKDVVWEAPEGYWTEESQLVELDGNLTSPYEHEDDWVETNQPIKMVLIEFRNVFKVISKETGQSYSSVGLKGSLRTSWQFSPEQYFSLSFIPDSGGLSDISLGTLSFKIADGYGLLVKTSRKDIYLAEIQPNLFVTVRESKTLNPEANLIGLPLLHRLGFMVTNSSDIGNIAIGAIPQFFSKFKKAKFISLPELFGVEVNLLHHHFRLIKYLIIFITIVVTGVTVYISYKIGCVKKMLIFVIALLACAFIIATESRYFFVTVLVFGMLIVIGAFALGTVFYNFSNERNERL